MFSAPQINQPIPIKDHNVNIFMNEKQYSIYKNYLWTEEIFHNRLESNGDLNNTTCFFKLSKDRTGFGGCSSEVREMREAEWFL